QVLEGWRDIVDRFDAYVIHACYVGDPVSHESGRLVLKLNVCDDRRIDLLVDALGLLPGLKLELDYVRKSVHSRGGSVRVVRGKLPPREDTGKLAEARDGKDFTFGRRLLIVDLAVAEPLGDGAFAVIIWLDDVNEFDRLEK